MLTTDIQNIIDSSAEITGIYLTDGNTLIDLLRSEYSSVKYTATEISVNEEEKTSVKESCFAVPEGFEKQYRIFEMFVIRKPENPVIVRKNYESITEFFNRISNDESMKQLSDFINKYSTSFDFIERFRKKIIDFRSRTDKPRQKILESITGNSGNIIQSEPAREAVKKVMEDFKSYIMNGILEPSSSRLSDEDEPKENIAILSELIEKLNKYISAIGIYTYSEVYPSKEMSDDDYEYYENLDTLNTSNAELSDVCKEIHYLPYIMEYERRNRPEYYYNSGSIVIYTCY